MFSSTTRAHHLLQEAWPDLPHLKPVAWSYSLYQAPSPQELSSWVRVQLLWNSEGGKESPFSAHLARAMHLCSHLRVTVLIDLADHLASLFLYWLTRLFWPFTLLHISTWEQNGFLLVRLSSSFSHRQSWAAPSTSCLERLSAGHPARWVTCGLFSVLLRAAVLLNFLPPCEEGFLSSRVQQHALCSLQALASFPQGSQASAHGLPKASAARLGLVTEAQPSTDIQHRPDHCIRLASWVRGRSPHF